MNEYFIGHKIAIGKSVPLPTLVSAFAKKKRAFMNVDEHIQVEHQSNPLNNKKF
jgi:hypothetical protein